MAKQKNAPVLDEESQVGEANTQEETQETAEVQENSVESSEETGVAQSAPEGTLGDLQINFSVPIGDRGHRAIAMLKAEPKVQTMVPVLGESDGKLLEGNYNGLAWVVERGKLISIPRVIADVLNEHVASNLLMKQKERATRS